MTARHFSRIGTQKSDVSDKSVVVNNHTFMLSSAALLGVLSLPANIQNVYAEENSANDSARIESKSTAAVEETEGTKAALEKTETDSSQKQEEVSLLSNEQE